MHRVPYIVALFLAATAASGMTAVAQTAGVGPKAGMPDVIQGPIHRTANGAMVPTPDLATLDCPAMRAVLERIDRSGYRDASPVAEGEPDHALFEYENALTARYFKECRGDETVPRDPTSIFLRGFWSD
jgi:hypothetical protein